MARIRTIKPEFWLSETQGSLSREHRMLAAALLNHCDDEGYFRAHPALVAGACCPYDDDGREFVAKAMKELQRIGYLEIDCDGRVGRIVKFKENQVINRPAASKLALGFEPSVPIHPAMREGSVIPHGRLSESSRTEVEVEQGSGTGKLPLSTSSTEAQEVFEHWRERTGHTKAQFDKKRRRAVEARLENYDVEDLKAAIDGCLKTPHNIGQNERGERYDDLELICRDAAHVDRFMRNAVKPPAPPTRSAGRATDADKFEAPSNTQAWIQGA